MPPKKKHGHKPLTPTTNANTVDTSNMDADLPDGRGLSPLEDMSQYNEEQRDEFLALEAIYADGFQKLDGKKSAWQKYDNLAYSIHLTALSDLDIFVHLEVELPKDYPKVEPIINIGKINATTAAVSTKIRQLVKAYPKENTNKVFIYDLCDAMSQILEDDASVKAGRKPVLTLEEERMAQQAAALQEEQQQMQRLQHQDTDEDTEVGKTLKPKTKISRPAGLVIRKPRRSVLSDVGQEPNPSPGLVSFSQPMTARDVLTKNEFTFNRVCGNTKLLERKDKTVTLVTPLVSSNIHVPQLMLKDIRLPEHPSETAQLQDTMREIEDLLEETKEYRHLNIVDVLGYSIHRSPLVGEDGSSLSAYWELAILTEYTRKGSLKEHLEITTSLRADVVRSWGHQLLEALEFFEKHGYVHPAVHEGNVLIFLAPRGDVTIKLSDGYGTALRTLVNNAKPATATDTPFWEAPELARSYHARTSKTCVWELGLVMLKMASGLTITEEFTSPSDCIASSGFVRPFQDLLVRMFEDDPQRRLKAFDLENVEFFRDTKDSLFNARSGNVPLTPSRRRRQSSSKTLNSYNRYEQEWTEIVRIGKGGQASVFKARYNLDGQLYAVKKVVCGSQKDLEILVAEIKLLSRINHPHVVRYFNAWDEKEYSSIEESEETEESSDDASNAVEFSSSNDPFGLPSTGVDIHFSAPPIENIGIQFGHSKPPGAEPGIETIERAFRAQNAANSGWSSSSDKDNNFPGGTDIETEEDHQQRNTTPREVQPEKITLYIQMELCENRSLRPYLLKVVNDAKEGFRIFRQMLEGLAHIHEQGVVHRDLKPDNIFLDAGNNVRIGDFGLATTGQVSGSSRPHIRNTASRATYSIGTPLYIAPELKGGGEHGYTTKADMFSLGIIFFEMCQEMTTAMERISMLKELGAPFCIMPDKFSVEEWSTQGEIILRLVNQKQDKRPSAADLLDGGEVPQPVKDEDLQKYINTLVDKDPDTYARLIAKYFDAPVPKVKDISWISRAEDIPNLSDKALSVFVRSLLEAVFRRHGAVRTNRQNVFPKSEHYDAAATFLDKSGMVLQLPYDLMLPFARAIAHKKPNYQKAYVIGSVFRTAGTPAEPIRRTEASFDFLSESALDLSLKEAETIKVLDECIGAFPELKSRKINIYLNHGDLLRLILNFCRIRPEQHTEVIKHLSRLNVGQVDWQSVHKTLRSKKINIMETSLTTLARFDFHDDVEGTTIRLSKILEGDPRLDRMRQLMIRLGQVTSCLARFKVNTDFYISPLSNNSESLYQNYLMFQCIDHTSRKHLASGGRYDDLVKSFQERPGNPKIRAVGVRIAVFELIALINVERKQHLESRMIKGMSNEIAVAALPRRCEVLVVSFDYKLHSSIGLDLIQDLWGHGINAELTDPFRSLDEFLVAYKSEPHCWAVIIRPDNHSLGGYTVKVRHLMKKDETEVHQSDLVSFLKNELEASQEQGPVKLRRMASAVNTSTAATDSSVDVVVLTSQHKSKKTNRQTIIDAALAQRRDLADSFVSGAPIVAVETSDAVLESIRSTCITIPESWRAMIQAAPQQEARYLQELQEKLKGWAEEGKGGAFVFNHRTRGCIYYDLGGKAA